MGIAHNFFVDVFMSTIHNKLTHSLPLPPYTFLVGETVLISCSGIATTLLPKYI
jgi:hypothetical protein